MSKQRIDKIIYQSWHRGCKETDILLGNYAKSEIRKLEDSDLVIYEDLLEENDWDIYGWIIGTIKTPDKYNKLIEDIKSFSVDAAR